MLSARSSALLGFAVAAVSGWAVNYFDTWFFDFSQGGMSNSVHILITSIPYLGVPADLVTVASLLVPFIILFYVGRYIDVGAHLKALATSLVLGAIVGMVAGVYTGYLVSLPLNPGGTIYWGFILSTRVSVIGGLYSATAAITGDLSAVAFGRFYTDRRITAESKS
jgi:hypothetical protein